MDVSVMKCQKSEPYWLPNAFRTPISLSRPTTCAVARFTKFTNAVKTRKTRAQCPPLFQLFQIPLFLKYRPKAHCEDVAIRKKACSSAVVTINKGPSARRVRPTTLRNAIAPARSVTELYQRSLWLTRPKSNWECSLGAPETWDLKRKSPKSFAKGLLYQEPKKCRTNATRFMKIASWNMS